MLHETGSIQYIANLKTLYVTKKVETLTVPKPFGCSNHLETFIYINPPGQYTQNTLAFHSRKESVS
jgi:hypothetical protein